MAVSLKNASARESQDGRQDGRRVLGTRGRCARIPRIQDCARRKCTAMCVAIFVARTLAFARTHTCTQCWSCCLYRKRCVSCSWAAYVAPRVQWKSAGDGGFTQGRTRSEAWWKPVGRKKNPTPSREKSVRSWESVLVCAGVSARTQRKSVGRCDCDCGDARPERTRVWAVVLAAARECTHEKVSRMELRRVGVTNVGTGVSGEWGDTIRLQ